MPGHLLIVGDHVGDLHPEVREGLTEGPDPAACRHGKLPLGYFVQYIWVAGIDCLLNQTPDQQLVVLGDHLAILISAWLRRRVFEYVVDGH